MNKSAFINDMKEIDDKINFDPAKYPVRDEPLMVAFMPYYVDPDSMGLTVLLKRELHPGSFHRTGRKMGLSTINIELPMDKQVTIEEAFKQTGLDVNVQNATPFGSVMTTPKDSVHAIEMVLVHVDPPEPIDEARCIVKQVPNEYEIGTIPFDEMLGTIQDNFLQDITTRLMLSELYIMAVEEANNQQGGMDQSQFSQNSNGGSIIGGGGNHPQEFYDNVESPEPDDMPKTSAVADEVLAQNAQKDFGAIYSKK